MVELEELLDWLVELNIQFYKTESFVDYVPDGNSHFYFKGSLERFTTIEMIRIFRNQMDGNLNLRWRNAVADVARKSTKSL